VFFFSEDNQLKIGHLTKTIALRVVKKKVTPLMWRYLVGKLFSKNDLKI
jgi:hypothetical protein